MIKDKKAKVIIVMPAYNAAKTLTRTVKDIPSGLVEEVILVDDRSTDETVTIAAIAKDVKIGEVPIPVRYYEESSSIQFWLGVKFGLGSLATLILYLIHKWGVYHSTIFR